MVLLVLLIIAWFYNANRGPGYKGFMGFCRFIDPKTTPENIKKTNEK